MRRAPNDTCDDIQQISSWLHYFPRDSDQPESVRDDFAALIGTCLRTPKQVKSKHGHVRLIQSWREELRPRR